MTGSVFRYAPTKGAEAIGETEGNGAGIAGGEEKSAALRPWTRAGSPCAEAKPIAFDAADLLQFWRRERRETGSTRLKPLEWKREIHPEPRGEPRKRHNLPFHCVIK